MHPRSLLFVLLAFVLCVFPASLRAEPAQAPRAGHVRMAFLTVKPDQLEAFRRIVREEMEASVRLEPGVLGIYALADEDSPGQLRFVELYADAEAYEKHRKTPHFQKFFRLTKDMVTKRVLLSAVPLEMFDKRDGVLTPPSVK